MKKPYCYLIDATGYVPGTGVTVFRYGTHGYTTSPTDTPASVLYLPRVKNPGNYRADLYEQGTTGGASRTAAGEVVLSNADGYLDALLDYGFGGRELVIRAGLVGAAYNTFGIIFTGTVEQITVDGVNLVFRLRDKQVALSQPIQTARYGGTNVLPAGIDGGPEIKGQLIPAVKGALINAPAICINTSRHIYQVSDGAINSISAVYDSGVPLRKQSSDFSSAVIDTITVDNISRGFAKSYSSAYPATFATISQAAVMQFISESTRAIFRTVNLTITNPGNAIPICAISDTVFAVCAIKATAPHKIALVNSTTGGVVEITVPNSRKPIAIAYSANQNMLIIGANTDNTDYTFYTMDCATNTFSAALVTLASGTALSGQGLYISDRDEVYFPQSSAGSSMNSVCVFNTATSAIARTVDISATEAMVQASRDAATGRTYMATTNNSILVLEDGQTSINRALSISTPVVTWYCHVNAAERLLYFADNSGWLYVMDLYNKGILAQVATGVPFARLLANDNIVSTMLFVPISYSPAYIRTVKMVGTPLADYANQTEMEAAQGSPLPGFYRTCPTMGMFRTGSKPFGAVTCDALQGATSADRTAAQVMKSLAIAGGISSGSIVAADITALDAANSAVVGVCALGKTTAELLDQVARSIGAWWSFDANGQFRCGRLTPPAGTEVVNLTGQNSLILSRKATNDDSRGVPNWKATVQYAHNWTVQNSGLAGYVSAERAAYLALEYRSTTTSDTAIQTLHLLSPELVVETQLTTEADAATEATRLLALYGVRRDRLEVNVPYDVARLHLMDLVKVTTDRYGYAAGKLFWVIGLDNNYAANKQTVTLWG